MEEDSLITSFSSYFLSGTHDYAEQINNITKTYIYYDNGLVKEIDGGYLDLGLIDTLVDMSVCLIGTICYLIYEIIFKIIKTKKIKEIEEDNI